MFGGTAGVVVLVVGVLVVLLVAGTALALHARRARRRTAPPARRTSWPRPEARGGTDAGTGADRGTDAGPHEDGPHEDGPTTRLPLDRDPVPGGPIDSAAAQRDPDTVVTRRDDPPGSLFEPSTPDDRPPPRR